MIIFKNTSKKFYCKRVKSLKAPRDVSSTCSISLFPKSSSSISLSPVSGLNLEDNQGCKNNAIWRCRCVARYFITQKSVAVALFVIPNFK